MNELPTVTMPKMRFKRRRKHVITNKPYKKLVAFYSSGAGTAGGTVR